MQLGFSRHPIPEFPRHPPPEFPRCQLPHKATKIRNDRVTVARWLGADLPPSVLEGGAREAGGPGPPRVIPRRDVVNQPQPHSVGTFAERHPANSPPLLLLSNIPSSIPSDIPATNQNQQQLDFVRRKAGFHGQSEKMMT